MTRTNPAARKLAVLALAAAPVLLLGGPAALAQNFGGSGGIAGNGFQPPVKGGGVVNKPAGLPPPPALPGAVQHGTPIPSSKAATDMSPNDALFDSINRGDLAGARDALSRGADLSSKDVLGMTPLELSVDLARNDITFLLLSLRSTDSDRGLGPSPGAGGVAVAPLPHGHGKGSRRFALASAAAEPHLSATLRAVRPPPGLPPATVRYAGSEPGTPVPQAGFLGFGAAP